MPKTKAFDRKAWLEDILKDEEISKEERAALEKTLGREKVSERLGASVMRLSDYSSKQDELRSAREEFEQERKKATQEHRQKLEALSTWEGDAKAKLAASEKARQEAEERVKRAEERYRRAAGDLDDDDLDDPKPTKATGLSREEVDALLAEREEKFRKSFEEKYNKDATDLVNVMAVYPIELQAIKDEHRRLFGEELDLRALHKQHRDTGEPMDDLWKKQFKVDERRAEMIQEDINKKLADAREEGRKAAMEELSRPPMVEPDRYGSAAMRAFAVRPKEPAEDSEGMTGVERAILAHREHKHAPPGSPHYKGNQGGAA